VVPLSKWLNSSVIAVRASLWQRMSINKSLIIMFVHPECFAADPFDRDSATINMSS
jgi:hypothetical protein